MAEQEQETEHIGTFVLAELGRATVVVGDVRDITEHIGKTVTVHADGDTRRVKLSSQWQSARHGGTFFPLYRETGELKRNGEPKRERTGYRIGAAHVSDSITAEPMTFADAMLFLNASTEAPADTAGKSKSMTRNVVKNAEPTAGMSRDAAPASDAYAAKLAELMAAGVDAATAATVARTLTLSTEAPADTASKSTASKPRSKSTRGKSTRQSKSTAADDVASLLDEL